MTWFNVLNLVGFKDGNTTVPVSATDRLPVEGSSTIAQEDIILGLRSGVQFWDKFGYQNDLDTADGLKPVWPLKENFTIVETSGTFDVLYDNTVDGNGTTGALSLQIDYLDGNNTLQQSNHVLGSTGNDTTSFSGLGINRARVLTTGTNKKNANNISIRDSAGNTTQAYIPGNSSITQQLIFHCPESVTPIMNRFFLSSARESGGGGEPRLEITLTAYNRTSQVFYQIRQFEFDVSGGSQVGGDTSILFNDTDVIYVEASTDVTNTKLAGSFGINLYDD